MFEDQITLAERFIERVKICCRDGSHRVPQSEQVSIDEWSPWFKGTGRVISEVFGPNSPESKQWQLQRKHLDEKVRLARKQDGDLSSEYLAFFRTCLALLHECNSMEAAVTQKKPKSFSDLLFYFWPKRRVLQILIFVTAGTFVVTFAIWNSLPEALQIRLIEQKMERVAEKTEEVKLLTDQYQQHPKTTSDSLSIVNQLTQRKGELDADLQDAKKQLAEYKRLYGDVPQRNFQTRIDQAEQVTQATKSVFQDVVLELRFPVLITQNKVAEIAKKLDLASKSPLISTFCFFDTGSLAFFQHDPKLILRSRYDSSDETDTIIRVQGGNVKGDDVDCEVTEVLGKPTVSCSVTNKRQGLAEIEAANAGKDVRRIFSRKQEEFAERAFGKMNWDTLKPYGPVQGEVWKKIRVPGGPPLTVERWELPARPGKPAGVLLEVSAKVPLAEAAEASKWIADLLELSESTTSRSDTKTRIVLEHFADHSS